MEPDEKGVLRLEGGSKDDDLDLVNGQFYSQIEDYELFQSCNILTIEEECNGKEFPKEFREIKEGNTHLDGIWRSLRREFWERS